MDYRPSVAELIDRADHGVDLWTGEPVSDGLRNGIKEPRGARTTTPSHWRYFCACGTVVSRKGQVCRRCKKGDTQ